VHITEQKQELRRAIKERLDRMTPEERHAESRSLCRVLLKKLPIEGVICAYFPLKTEADMRPLFQELLARGNKVYLPRFEDNKMVYRRLMNIDDNLVPGEFTIPEPPKTAEPLNQEEAKVILVPGRAFDKTGARLGRGSGGFDSWIAAHRKRHPATQFWGVCLQCQLVTEVPVEPHDEKMDIVATANEWLEIPK